MEIYKIIGAGGLLLVSAAIIINKRRTQNALYILGGACLAVYSFYIGDRLFIALQIIFILAAMWDLYKHQKDMKIGPPEKPLLK